MRKTKEPIRHNPDTIPAQIIKVLERNTSSGRRPPDIFEDWIETVAGTLDRLPEHVRSVRRTGAPADDTPATQAVWAKLRTRYDAPIYFERFKEAFHLLLDSTTTAAGDIHWMDALGLVFMEFVSHGHNGQFFTPWPIAKMMAEMTVGNGAEEVRRRLTLAIEKSPAAVVGALDADEIKDDTAAGEWFFKFVLPMAIEHYEPVRVLDPACGSGIMFLAAASVYPRWMIHNGLVQFYGMDIDRTCVAMARINCQLYGLNGHSLRWAIALTEPELQALPEPHASIYREAQATHAADPKATVKTARAQLALPGVLG